LDIIKRLVDAGADPYIRDSDGKTALTMTQLWKNKLINPKTVYYGKKGGRSRSELAPLPSSWVDVGLALLRSRSQHAPQALAKTFEDGNTTFVLATISAGQFRLANAAIQAGADVNAKHYDTRTGPVFGPYSYTRDAYTGGVVPCSDMYFHPKIEGTFTPLSYLLYRISVSWSIILAENLVDLIERFIEKGAVLTCKERYKYVDAINRSSVVSSYNAIAQKMLLLLAQTCSPLDFIYPGTGKYNMSPLMLACQLSNVDMVALFLSRGANPDFRDSKGQTALFYAVKCAKAVEIVQMLVDTGANVSVVDNSGATALAGADPESKDAVKAIIDKARK
jgi:hypothetical protein